MNQGTILISFIVAILGIGYPILLQAITRLDEKYNSTFILDLIKKELELKVFKYSLYINLIITAFYLLKRPLILDYGFLNLLLQDYGLGLLYISTLLLVTSYILFIIKTIKYYHPEELVKYLSKKAKLNKEIENKPLNALVDILVLGIRNADDKYLRTLTSFFNNNFERKRKEMEENPQPNWEREHIKLMRKGTEEIANQKSYRISFLFSKIIGGSWLLGDKTKNITEQTYSILWANLLYSLEFNRPDLVMEIWKNSHEYFKRNYKDYPNKEIDLNEKMRFLEFHYAIGGLLLYKKQYQLFNEIFNYTTNWPPQYVLLPKSFDEIIQFYLRFNVPEEYNIPFIDSRYPYSYNHGLDAENKIKDFTSKYLGLLVIRQYTLHQFYIFDNPLSEPTIPTSQKQKKQIIRILPGLKQVTSELLEDNELLSAVGFENLSKYIQEHPTFTPPSRFIDNYIENLKQKLDETDIKQRIDENKKSQFMDSAIETLADTYSSINLFEDKKEEDEFTEKRYVAGESMLFPNDVFGENPAEEYDHQNILSNYIADNIRRSFSDIVYTSIRKEYLIDDFEVFKAIDRLKIKNEDDYVILSLGNNIQFIKEKDSRKIDNSPTSYNQMDIIELKKYSRVFDGNLFIIKKSDLPIITPLDVDQKLIEKYKLESIHEKLKIEGSIIKLIEHKNIKEVMEKQHNKENLDNYVIAFIALWWEIKWKKDTNGVVLKINNRLSEQGISNDLNEIKPLK